MSFTDNIKNKRRLKSETNLFVVEPLVESTPSWMKTENVPHMEMAKTLDFRELKGKKMYAKFVWIEGKSYWRLYITDVNTTSIVYVNTAALNPVGQYKP